MSELRLEGAAGFEMSDAAAGAPRTDRAPPGGA